MTTFARGLSTILSLVVIPATCAVFAGSCGADPVGVESCRVIEAARCEALKSCGSSETDATYCVAFYRDQCLHGFANGIADVSSAATNACVEAIRAVSTCAATGAMTIAQCSSVSFVAGADTTAKPCDIITGSPRVLTGCAFLESEDSSSSSSSASSSSSSASSSSGSADAGTD